MQVIFPIFVWFFILYVCLIQYQSVGVAPVGPYSISDGEDFGRRKLLATGHAELQQYNRSPAKSKFDSSLAANMR